MCTSKNESRVADLHGLKKRQIEQFRCDANPPCLGALSDYRKPDARLLNTALGVYIYIYILSI